ncbi:hypothetical protein [Aliidiomarina quisquiliarum]|uniref:hypothetical protein n=1 Tax=Aliidiomarina quisquiliarum TaxID=2938947 RepID=UPI00208F0A1F|nr:hypothetical protein [Aliidiomarina quisquiliarum]MCO4319983.1 hypothetical protein [Aliidiomarina quisquiliarum]
MQKLKMVFKVGARRIEAPNQDGSLAENLRLLKQQFPFFRWTDVLEEDGQVHGNELVYPVELPPAKTNG